MGIASYVVNFDELVSMLNLDALSNLDLSNLADLDLSELKNILGENGDKADAILETLLKTENMLKQIRYEVVVPGGMQKIKGLTLSVPAVANDYVLAFKPSKNILLTGITFSQSAWKYEDNWDLVVGDIATLFESVYTKELGEHKQFNKFYPVPAKTDIYIVLHNVSGNSRQVWADIEYLLLEENSETPTAPIITHDYDWRIESFWGPESVADIDLHIYLDDDINKHIYFNKDEYREDADNRMFLDHDQLDQFLTTVPEIATIQGFINSKAKITLNNYNAAELLTDVTLKIYKKEDEADTLVKEYTIQAEKLDCTNTHTFEICEIELGTGTITDILSNV